LVGRDVVSGNTRTRSLLHILPRSITEQVHGDHLSGDSATSAEPFLTDCFHQQRLHIRAPSDESVMSIENGLHLQKKFAILWRAIVDRRVGIPKCVRRAYRAMQLLHAIFPGIFNVRADFSRQR